MAQPLAYRVVVTTSRGLNIMLTNKREAQLRTYSHFVKQDEARSFADTLEKCLSNANYSDLERCPVCGEAFTRQNRLCRLKDSRIVHRKCFQKAARQGEIPYDNCKEYFFEYFPKDTPEFDFSNLTYEERTNELRYAIQIVSKPVIHLYLIAPGEYIKRHVCFTYEECIGLIMEIRCRLEELRNTAIGHCAHCSAVVYEDKTYYTMSSGELIHGTCMEKFIQSFASKKVKFPARCFYPHDTFGHRRLFGESFDPNPFPQDS